MPFEYRILPPNFGAGKGRLGLARDRKPVHTIGMATLPSHDLTHDLTDGLPLERFVSEEEYLTTTYRPDCDYVDGRLEERNLGERDHAFLQTIFSLTFMNKRKAWGVVAATDWRVQVRKKNYRIPDVTVLPTGSSKERILRQPPLLVIEILSPRDTLQGLFTFRHQEYLDRRSRDATGVVPDRGRACSR
jgi:Uma2 family endonuclease